MFARISDRGNECFSKIAKDPERLNRQDQERQGTVRDYADYTSIRTRKAFESECEVVVPTPPFPGSYSYRCNLRNPRIQISAFLARWQSIGIFNAGFTRIPAYT